MHHAPHGARGEPRSCGARRDRPAVGIHRAPSRARALHTDVLMFERARERLAGLDPGGFSGRAAVRATVGMTATAALGIPATGYVGAPPTLAMGGAVLAMLSALA